jgi:HlyD family secretion protein
MDMNKENIKADIPKKKTALFKKKWFKRSVAIVLVAAIACGGFVFYRSKKSGESQEAMSTAIITRGDIEVSVTGSGTVEAYETYSIVPTINGEIIFCDVEEGDMVEEGQVLYRFDSEQSDNAIKTAENNVKTSQSQVKTSANSVESSKLSLEQANQSVSDLTIKASASGVVSGLNVGVGDSVQGTVCSITDNTYMIASIPVSSNSVSSVSVGNSVTVVLEKYMTQVVGTVNRISNTSVAGSNGSMVTYVDVKVSNPGSIAEGTMATATINAASGKIEGAAAAALSYPDAVKVNAEQSGTVSKINVKNGDWVNSGDVIMVLSNQSVTNNAKSAQMNYENSKINYENAQTSYENSQTSLSNTKKSAEDYVLTAPISGKVLSKQYKKGDTVYSQNSTTLMTIADTSKMKFTINVDELDVAMISVGQEVDVTADAIEGEMFKGEITTVSLLGTSANGVTYYPVEVTINEPGDLLPGMNVDAEIITQSAQNVILAPVDAVSYYNGSYYVTVVGEAEVGGAPQREEGGAPQEMPTGDMPNEMPTGDMPEGGAPNGGGNSSKGGKNSSNTTLYSEEKRVEVKCGISNDDYIVIEEGLSEGDVVKVTASSSSSSSTTMMGGMDGGMGGGMGGMSGGGGGGGAPGGGGGGGAPGGGGGGPR